PRTARTIRLSATRHHNHLEVAMSVYVIGQFKADQGLVQKLWDERPDAVIAVSDDAKSQGCLSHQWGFGEDGVVVLIDEWKDAPSFQNFFDNQKEIPELM